MTILAVNAATLTQMSQITVKHVVNGFGVLISTTWTLTAFWQMGYTPDGVTFLPFPETGTSTAAFFNSGQSAGPSAAAFYQAMLSQVQSDISTAVSGSSSGSVQVFDAFAPIEPIIVPPPVGAAGTGVDASGIALACPMMLYADSNGNLYTLCRYTYTPGGSAAGTLLQAAHTPSASDPIGTAYNNTVDVIASQTNQKVASTATGGTAGSDSYTDPSST